jgi:hypothetical protein
MANHPEDRAPGESRRPSPQKGVRPWTVSSSRISPPLESTCSSASRPLRYSSPLSIPPSLVFRSKWAYEALTRGTWVRGHPHGLLCRSIRAPQSRSSKVMRLQAAEPRSTTVTPAEIIYHRRVQVLDHAGRTSVAEACRTFGVPAPATTAGRAAQGYGLTALLPKDRQLPVMPTATPPTRSKRCWPRPWPVPPSALSAWSTTWPTAGSGCRPSASRRSSGVIGSADAPSAWPPSPRAHCRDHLHPHQPRQAREPAKSRVDAVRSGHLCRDRAVFRVGVNRANCPGADRTAPVTD